MRHRLQAEVLLGKGQRAAAAGNMTAALAAYDRALDICPGYAPAHLYRAISLSAQQAHDRAAASVQAAVAIDPRRPAYRLVQGMVAYDAGDISRALASFEEAVRQSPANRLAAACVRLSAIRRDLPAPDPDDLAVLDGLMTSTNAAFQARWLVLCESALNACRPRARTLAEQIIFDTYTAPLHKADRTPSDRLRLWLSRWKAALGALTPARRSALALQRQADIRLAAGDWQEATACMGEAVSLIPGATVLKDKYLDLCLYSGQFDPLLSAIGSPAEIGAMESDASGQGDAEPYLLAMLGLVRFHQGFFEKAVALLQQAAEGDPLDFSAPYFLGASHVAGQARETARFWFQQAVSLPNPGIGKMRLEEWRRCLGHRADMASDVLP